MIGIGKTTVCKKLVSMMEERNCKFDGFYTEEIRDENGSRIGFDVVRANDRGQRSTLARVSNMINQSQRTKYKVGSYHVFVDDFETIALLVFDSNTDILIIDEIGKMELFSQKFHDNILKLFFETSNKPFIIATVPSIDKIPQQYLSQFRRFYEDKESEVIVVNRENRHELPKKILNRISL